MIDGLASNRRPIVSFWPFYFLLQKPSLLKLKFVVRSQHSIKSVLGPVASVSSFSMIKINEIINT
jgi:hypothetical protein